MVRKLVFGNVFENWVKKLKFKLRGLSKELLLFFRKFGRSYESKLFLVKFFDIIRLCEIV